MRLQRAFTLVELLVAVALAALVLTLAIPAFSDFILMQRMKSVNAQLVTDLQFARSEAASRNMYVRLRFQSDSNTTCYSIYTLKPGSGVGVQCSCLSGVGLACASDALEIRTVVVPRSLSVNVLPQSGMDPYFAFDYRTGGLVAIPTDDIPEPLNSIYIDTAIDTDRTLRTTLNSNGRPTVCRASAKVTGGFQTCV